MAADVLYSVTDLGSLGGGTTHAYGINNLGQVTGESNGRAFLYSNGQMIDLGTGFGYAINDEGVIVGSTSANFLVAYLGEALLHSNGRMVGLNDAIDPTLGVHLGSAMGINDAGQIIANGGDCAYLLTPIPEPAALPHVTDLPLTHG